MWGCPLRRSLRSWIGLRHLPDRDDPLRTREGRAFPCPEPAGLRCLPRSRRHARYWRSCRGSRAPLRGTVRLGRSALSTGLSGPCASQSPVLDGSSMGTVTTTDAVPIDPRNPHRLAVSVCAPALTPCALQLHVIGKNPTSFSNTSTPSTK